ncbi:MAG: hypothetical protein IJS24_05880 [Eubacterium sp.]|nr:hypothetical protein [Eubacterium sp.]
MRERVLEAENYYCHHISVDDFDDISGFRVKRSDVGQGLADYLVHVSIQDEQMGIMRTYLVRDDYTDEIVGYYSLKSGMVSLNEHEIGDGNKAVFDTLPGVELANFAVDQRYIEAHSRRNVGLKVFRHFARPMALKYSKYIGAALLYIYALPEPTLISRYIEEYGFLRLN